MAFDPVSWVFSYGLGKVGDRIIKYLTPSELSVRLEATVRDWASGLGAERWADPVAIFSENEPEPGPARRLLAQRLTDSKLPAAQEWHDALLERWETVSAVAGERQPFFALTDEEAAHDLRQLAERLATVCRSDEKMYRASMIGLAERMEAWHVALRDREGEPDARLLVRTIDAPERYDASYKIAFHVFYGGSGVVLIERLRINVISVLPVHRYAVKTPGAPAKEYRFAARLEPRAGNYEMSSRGPRRFQLSSGNEGRSELFRLEVEAQQGWAYLAQIVATQVDLQHNKSTDIATPEFWLTFEA